MLRLPDNIKIGVDYIRSVYINAILYNVFIGGRENAKGIYVKDVVTMFKLFY